MNSKIHTVKFHSSAPEVLQAIDSIGWAQCAAYNIMVTNTLMTKMMRLGSLPNTPPELVESLKENIEVLNSAFTLWCESLNTLAGLREDLLLSNKIASSAVIGTPANVAEHMCEELATDTEFDS